MKLAEEIISILEDLNPQIDESKARNELDPSATAISMLVKDQTGLSLIEYITDELENGRLPIYTFDKLPSTKEMKGKIAHFYFNEPEAEILNILLMLYHQFWYYNDESTRVKFFKKVEELRQSVITKADNSVYNICNNCTWFEQNSGESCKNCEKKDLLKIREIKLTDTTRKVLKNDQFLEIYVKECMRESGIQPIGWKLGDHKVYTSIKYHFMGEEIEIDAHGIPNNKTLMICEAKTSKKITINEMRRIENIFDKLGDRINEYRSDKFKIKLSKVFIITGEFDQNILKAIGAYKMRGWDLIGRDKISNLALEFDRIKQEL
jgi:hypothetical protein